MATKSKSKAAFSRQRNAANKAFAAEKYDVAIANFSRALAQKAISDKQKIEMLQGRAASYKAIENIKAMAADVEELAILQQKQIDHTQNVLDQAQAELDILSGIAEALKDQQELDTIVAIVGAKVQQFFNAEIASIGLYDESTGLIDPPYYYDRGRLIDVPPFKYGEGVTSYVIRNAKAVLINNASESKKLGSIFNEELPSESALYVPILVGKKAIGVLTIQASEKNAFSKHQLELLASIASNVAVALENARLSEETIRRNAELAVINSVQEALAQELDLLGIYRVVGKRVLEIFNGHTFVLNSFDLDAKVISYDYVLEKGEEFPFFSREMRLDEIAVVHSRKPFVLNEGFVEYAKKNKIEIDIGEAPKSVMLVPLSIKGKKMGAISIQDMDREFAYSESDVKLLETLAGSMAVALENARLFEDANRRNAELAVINSIQDALAKELDLKTVYRTVGQKIREIFDAHTIVVLSADPEKELITSEYVYEKGEEIYNSSRPMRKADLLALSLDQPLIVNENFSAWMQENELEVVDGEEPKSLLAVAYKIKGYPRGAISIENMDEENVFDPSDARLLLTIAKSMGSAIENARLFDEIQQSNQEITAALEQQNATSEVLNALANSPTDIQPVLDAVAKNAADLCEADDVQIYRVSGDRLPEVAHYGPLPALEPGESLPLTRGLLTGRAVLEKKPIHIEDFLEISKDEFPDSVKLQKRLGHRTALSMPLLKEGKAIGAIVVRRNEVKAFSKKQIALLTNFANQAAIAIENVRLFDETNQRNAELAIINSMQDALADELDIQAIYEAVGGKLREIFNVGAVSIIVYDLVEKTNNYVYGFEEGQRTPNIVVPTNKLHQASLDQGKSTMMNEGVHEIAAQLEAKAPQGKMPKSLLWVPLPQRGDQVTALNLMDMDHENAFTESDLRLLETLASSMSAALDNARLFDETQQRNAELAVINSVQSTLADELDIETIYQTVTKEILKIFDTDGIQINIYDLEAQSNTYVAGIEPGVEADGAFTVPINGLHRHAVKLDGPLLVNEDFEQFASNLNSKAPLGKLPQSFLLVKLPARGNLITAIILNNYKKENAFSASDVRLLETMAGSMSVALENARLFNETNQRNAELAIINSVGEAMSRNLDVATVAEIVGDKVQEIFQADSVSILLANKSRKLFDFVYDNYRGKKSKPDSSPIGTGLSAKIFKESEPLLFHTQVKAAKAGAVAIEGEGIDSDAENTESFMGVPIIVGKQSIGVVIVQNDAQNSFGHNDMNLLSTLASNMGVAIENARLFDETNLLLKESQRKQDELSAINTVSRALSSELDLEALIALVGEQVNSIFRADIAYLALVNESEGMIHFPYLHGEELESIKIGEGLVGQIITTGKPLLVNRDRGWKAAESKVDRVGVKAKSYLGVPILAGKRVMGAISVQSTKREGRFSEADMNLLSTIASNVGVAMRNVQLFEESEHRAQEMETLAQLGVELSQELDLDVLLKKIAEKALKSLDGQDVVIRSLEEDGSMPAIVAVGERAQIIGNHVGHINNTSITGSVLQSAKGEFVNHPEEDLRTESIPGIDSADIGPGVYAPLLSKSGPIGVLGVFRSRAKEKYFTHPDLNFAVGLARQATSAIENARLFGEIERQKKYFETFFEYSPAAVVVVDSVGTVTSWNPAAENLFGYHADEAIGHNVDDLVANDPRIELEAREYTRKFTGRNGGRVEVLGRRTRKDGSLVDVEVKGLPISVDGEMTGFLVIYHDVSVFEEARRAAEEANHAKSAFLANMSHELRTPLNAIIGFSRIVKRKAQDILPEKQIENLNKVLVSAAHLLDLINTVLDIAKIEAGRMELQVSNFDLLALIDGCLATTQPLLGSQVKLGKLGVREMPMIRSDQEKIRRILLNLLSNAAKFTHEGSIKVRTSIKNDEVTVAVKDTGIGIAEDNLRKIFDEFQQADNTTTREYGGTGLGLSISRSLAQLLGGDLFVTSKEGEGSTFSFTIPLHLGEKAVEAASAGDEIANMESENDLDKPLVLVIDDQPDVYNILQQNLEEAGYRVAAALSGEEGIEKARSLKPFAITLDIMMPRKDGWQVLYELKNDSATKDIPVIILTIVDNKAMGLRLGAADYLVKPLNEELVIAALERVAQSNGGTKPKKILVVDDDEKVFDLIKQMFEGQHLDIETAKNGQLALKQAEKNVPDVILLDLLMPKMDGFQFIEQVQSVKSLQKVPIIVLTAKSLTNDEQAQLEKSVAKIVQKQALASEDLVKQINKIVA